MKFRVVVCETVEVEGKKIIAYFEADKNKQQFEINCDFNAYQSKIRKWDVWDLNIKFRSEIFEDPKTGIKSYFTHFDCNKAEPIHVLGRK